MKIGRKILSCVLAFAMMLSCIGISAYAAATDDLTTNNFSLQMTEADSSLSVALICDKAVSAWGGSVGFMSITDASGVDASSYFTLNSITNKIGDPNNDVAQMKWSASANDYTNGDSLESGTWTTYVYTVSAEIPDGEYAFKMSFSNGECFDADLEDYSISGQSVSATYTVGGSASVTDPYTANISTTATDNTVVNGQDIEVKVNVGGTTGTFSSAQIVLDYDPAYLTYKSATTTSTDAQAPDYEVDADNGTLTIRDFGEAITAANGVYTVTFTAAKGGTTNVEITSAGFSTKERAETLDLLAATGLNELDVTINHKVTVNDEDAGSVTPNGSYEYTIPNYDGTNNTYDVTVTIGGVEQADPTIGTDGKFIISPVTGDLEITYTVTANKYTVTFTDPTSAVSNITGASLEEGVYKVTHGTDITFGVPANVEPVDTTDGYKYVVTVTETDDTSKTIEATSSDNGNGLTYTIDGDLIEADITITIEKEPVAASEVTVTITGEDVKASVDGTELTSPATVDKGSDVVLTLTPEVGYDYTVMVGDADVTEDILEDNQYTIENIQASVTVTVTKTLDKTSVSVQQYLTLDNTVMWLVTINGNGTEQITDKTYSYDNNNMFWSSEYQAYCYLVVADDLTVDDAETAIGDALVAQAATAVNYEMDVNMSYTKDVNDAQLVWNMYNAQYSGFTANVNMEKFLRADVNGSKGVDSTDAAAIISAIKTA